MAQQGPGAEAEGLSAGNSIASTKILQGPKGIEMYLRKSKEPLVLKRKPGSIRKEGGTQEEVDTGDIMGFHNPLSFLSHA
jgi:hypothetical protein